MKHEPRLAVHMEKQLGWAHKLGEAEPLGISKAGQTVLARMMESHIQYHLTGFVGGGPTKGTMASACLDARYLILPLHATGALQATIPEPEPRGRE